MEAVTDATFSEEEGVYNVLVHYTIEDQDILSGELSKVTSFELNVAVQQFVLAQWLARRLATGEVQGSNPGKGKNISRFS